MVSSWLLVNNRPWFWGIGVGISSGILSTRRGLCNWPLAVDLRVFWAVPSRWQQPGFALSSTCLDVVTYHLSLWFALGVTSHGSPPPYTHTHSHTLTHTHTLYM